MKKLLMLFSISAIVTGTSSSIVACGTKPDPGGKDINQNLLNKLKKDANQKFDNHFIKNSIPFISNFENANKKYAFFNETNLGSLFENSSQTELNLKTNNLKNLEGLKSDLQNSVNLSDLETSINSLKKSDENNYSVFLSNVANVYAGYDFGSDFLIQKSSDESGSITYSGEF
ncbi:hypothetical protein [Spiroplasma floricola]|uniref:Lipoprotein n=1 Tax=Spiroplasma floricola 23-6 TaxID=1336749 RepID=A0A2K8SEA3_9MOLU|nr:hypothetical protein [Spiroplasma floricola]AUB31786.1 hypothetical protein SFLOR_v1c07380 [Spiroplasma floricola 23-6]